MKHQNIALHDKKAVYFFTPKVACTSFKYLFAHVLSLDTSTNVQKLNFPFIPKDKILSTYKEYFRFAFVRNPWDRLVSCYKHKIREKDYNDKNYSKGVATIFHKFGDKFYGGMSFTAFIESVAQIPDNLADTHFRSQYYTVLDSFGNLIVEYIGRFEQLKNDTSYVLDKIGVEEEKLPHIMKTDHKHYREYYTSHTRKLVSQRFTNDIEMFQYSY